jgi:hypothetical protein
MVESVEGMMQRWKFGALRWSTVGGDVGVGVQGQVKTSGVNMQTCA